MNTQEEVGEGGTNGRGREVRVLDKRWRKEEFQEKREKREKSEVKQEKGENAMECVRKRS